jgi:hypothetical protein
MADGTYVPQVYRKDGGNELVVASGGVVTVESGGAIAIESGGTITSNGVDLMAELDALNGLDATELGYLNGVVAGTTTASKALVVSATKGLDFLQFGTTASTALVTGCGTAGTPYAMGTTAGQNAMGYWFSSTATSGDTRGLYLRQYFAGVGGSGEAARIFGTVNNVTAATGGTVNGAHITLSVSGASGAVSGAGNGLRVTLGLGDTTNAGGTLAAIQVDSDFHNGATVPATCAGIRFTNSNTKAFNYAFAFDGVNGLVWDDDFTGEPATAAGGIKVLVNGADRWIQLYSQAPS